MATRLSTICVTSFLLTICVQVLCNGNFIERKLRENQNACQRDASTRVEERILDFRNGNNVDQHQLYKHVVCVLRKQGYLLDDGEFDVKILKDDLRRDGHNERKIEKILEVCVKESEEKDKTYYQVQHFWKCLTIGDVAIVG